MTGIIEQISKVLTEAGVEHTCDPKIKNWKTKSYGPFKFPEGTSYYRIHNKKNYTIVSHYFEVGVDYLGITVPKIWPPDEILKKYGLEGGNPDPEEKVYKVKKHYYFIILLKNGLLNGKYSIQEKKDFFIDIARMRG
jgi:hypothetical protein